MGQQRAALVLGVMPEEVFLDWMSEGEGERWDWESGPTYTDSGLIGFPFAVAYDDSRGCAEMVHPTPLDRVSEVYPVHLAAAQVKWKAFAKLVLAESGIELGEPAVFLDEVERA